MADFIYDAFISYSHRDMKWGQWLQKKLETFRLPKDLLEKGEKPRNLKIFRDQTDLAGVALETALRKELDQSEYLIVICSPASAASRWVNDEVEYFHSLGKSDKIVPFIVEGEPESNHPELECFPPGLRSREDRHVLGANIQELGKEKAFLRLASILFDVRFNRLVDRERQRKRRRIALIGGSSAAVLAVVLGLVIYNVSVSRRLSYNNYISAMMEATENGLDITSGAEADAIDIDRLTVSAKYGNADADYWLALCYKNGWGTETDPEASFYWFKQGAEAGSVPCMVDLSAYYASGTGTEKDEIAAFNWSLKAAEAGNDHGMRQVALDYLDGIGTEKDPEKAFNWYLKAAEAGNEYAMEEVAMCYRDGIGCEPDKEAAFAWNMKLAERGNTTAMYNVAIMYQYSWGTEEDPEQTYYWFRKGAEAGNASCAYWTGWCTENHYGISDAALDWYQRAEKLAEESGEEDVAAAAREEISRLEGGE